MEASTNDRAEIRVRASMSVPQVHEFAAGVAAVFTTPCPEKTSDNEDALALAPYNGRSGVLIVADGLGGMPGGNDASRLAVQTLARAVTRAAREGLPLREAILNGIEAANNSVASLGIGAGTTLALVEVQDKTIRPYHVGDSMILLVGQRGKIKHQNIEHSPVGYAVEAGILDETEALHHEERHVVSNVVGNPDMRIEIGPSIPLGARDTLVIASDGLSDNLYVEEIVERIRKGSLNAAAQRLMTDAQERMRSTHSRTPGKEDDLTFVIFRLSSERRE